MRPGIFPVPDGWRPSRLTPALAVGGRLLLFSDSPEDVPAPGILYQETVTGPFRVCLHHANATTAPAGLYICIKNQGQRPAAISARATGAAWGASPGAAGQAALLMYLQNSRADTVRLPPGSWTRWGVPALAPGQTLSGVYDFDPGGPLAVYTLLAPAGADPDPDSLPLLPPDADHGRGTFRHATRSAAVAYRCSQGHVAAQLGNNPEWGRDASPWRRPLPGEFEQGWSVSDARTAVLLGNYGVNYMLEFRLHNDLAGSSAVRFVLEPRGGEYQGPLEFDGRPLAAPGPVAPGMAWLCHGVGLAAGERRRVRLRWLPANGSFLPVRLHLLPG